MLAALLEGLSLVLSTCLEIHNCGLERQFEGVQHPLLASLSYCTLPTHTHTPGKRGERERMNI